MRDRRMALLSTMSLACFLLNGIARAEPNCDDDAVLAEIQRSVECVNFVKCDKYGITHDMTAEEIKKRILRSMGEPISPVDQHVATTLTAAYVSTRTLFKVVEAHASDYKEAIKRYECTATIAVDKNSYVNMSGFIVFLQLSTENNGMLLSLFKEIEQKNPKEALDKLAVFENLALANMTMKYRAEKQLEYYVQPSKSGVLVSFRSPLPGLYP